MIKKYLRYVRRYPLPLWLGFAVIGGIQAKRLAEKKLTVDGEKHSWIVSGYKILPLKTLSRCWGFVNDIELPVWSRKPILGTYAKLFKCNLDEALETDLKSYKNLGEFFRRKLKDGVRQIDGGDNVIIAPCDGRIMHAGKVQNNGMLEAIKGVHYPIEDFLGFKPQLKNNDSKLYQYVIYLAPGDYHGFHSPIDWNIQSRNHFEGHLLSVSPKVVNKVPKLFNINERVVYNGQWNEGFFSMTAVGATNVGSIVVPNDKCLKTNCKSKSQNQCHQSTFDQWLSKKGQYFGEFNLGSTIVVIFESEKELKFNVNSGDCVLLGQAISSI